MNHKFTVKHLALTGLMAAVLCILSPFAIHVPISPVPISLGTLAIYFVMSVLGMKLGTLSVLIYILLGLVGLPVFAGFAAGPGTLLGPTGGYLIGYLFLALISGFFTDRWSRKLFINFLGMLLGTAACYLFGTIWLAVQLERSFFEALAIGVLPYLPADLLKLLIALAVGSQIRKRLLKSGLL